MLIYCQVSLRVLHCMCRHLAILPWRPWPVLYGVIGKLGDLGLGYGPQFLFALFCTVAVRLIQEDYPCLVLKG